MKIVVIGGTGLIGSKIVEQLGEHGHDAVAAVPNTGVNTITGEGLAEALAGADVVIDVSNSPSFEDAAVLEFFTTSTTQPPRRRAGRRRGHHVALPIVGTDRLPGERLPAREGRAGAADRGVPVPYSIVRATQFYEFVERIADAATDGDTVRLPHGLHPADGGGRRRRPPSAASPSARRSTASSRSAGPRRSAIDELIRTGLARTDDPRTVIADPDAQYFGTKLEDTSLLPGDGAQLAETRYQDWLSALATTA